jgi:TonB family protein
MNLLTVVTTVLMGLLISNNRPQNRSAVDAQLSLEKQAVADTRRTLASVLDNTLPEIPFAKWYEKVVGQKNGVVWQLSECGETRPNGASDAQACVEVNAVLSDGRKVIVMISVGTFKKGITGQPAFHFGVIEKDGDLRLIRRLGNLQNLLSMPWELAKNPPVALPEVNMPDIRVMANNIYLSAAALGNTEGIGQHTEIKEPAPEPPPARPQNSPPSLKQPESVQQIADEGLEGSAITRVEPIYPPTARALKAFGTVKVQIIISETGKVIDAKAISGHQALRSAAEDAAYKWVFKPTTVDGAPIKARGVLTFNFKSRPQ